MNKKGQFGQALIIGMVGIFLVFIIYITMAAPLNQIKNEFNDSFTSQRQYDSVANVERVLDWWPVIMILGIIAFIIFSAISRQNKEYYL